MKIVQAVLAAIAIVVYGTAPLHFAGGAAQTRKVEITAKRFTFDPAEITLKKGEPVTLLLQTQDVSHGLKFRELNVDVKASKGKPGEVEFTPDKTGNFEGHCSVFCGTGHGSMKLTLHVVE